MGDDPLNQVEDEQVARLLEAARVHLGMEMSWITRVEDGQMEIQHMAGGGFGLAPGDVADFETSYCFRVFGASRAGVIADVADDPRSAGMPVTAALAIGAYVGAPVRIDGGQLYGMMCCFSHQANPALQQRDAEFLAVFAELVGDIIERRERRLRGTRATRERIEQVLATGGPDMVFQPVYRLKDCTLIGYEALARFPAGHGGPDLWFADADRVGLSTDLELAAARAALHAFCGRHPKLMLGINASAPMVCDPRLVDVLAEHTCADVVLEITEHTAVHDWPELQAAIGALRERGVRISADDAGAGFAGFAHLVNLRPDSIKLDISITKNIDADPARRAMAAALVTFANTTGARLLAEGIETQNELDVVTALGIDLGQGYHLGRPEPLPEAPYASEAHPARRRAGNVNQNALQPVM